MDLLINWCNGNQGFISALLTIMSIALSVIAIIISVITAKLPFRKKIAVAYFTNIGVGDYEGIEFFSVEATNIGNRVIKINYVGVGVKKFFKWQKMYDLKKTNPSNIKLDINDSVEVQYDINQIRKEKNTKKNICDCS